MFPPINLFVAGIPAGQPRVKAANRGGFTSVYTPKRVKMSSGGYKTHPAEVWRQQIVAEVKRSLPTVQMIDAPVCLTLHCGFPRPKSHYTKKRLRPNAPTDHLLEPDADNTAKLVADLFTQLGIWRDDSLVCELHVTKRYSETPGCAITVKESGE